jgi:hypothetical protein
VPQESEVLLRLASTFTISAFLVESLRRDEVISVAQRGVTTTQCSTYFRAGQAG